MGYWFLQLPVRHKFKVIILLSCGTALLFAAAASMAVQWHFSREWLSRDILALSAIVGENCSEAILNRDSQVLTTVLASLVAKSSVTNASIFNVYGTLLARYPVVDSREKALVHAFVTVADQQGIFFHANHADVHQVIVVDGRKVGYLSLQVGMKDFYTTRGLVFLLMLCALLGGLVLAALMSGRLQRVVIDPLLSLLGTMKTIARSNDYTLRTTVFQDDEVGRLAEGFNEMLEKVERRDGQLADLVRERTLELAEAREQAGAADQARAQFLANMSREIRTPVNDIIAATQLARQACPGKEHENFWTTMQDSAGHLLAIVDDINEFSKLANGEIQLHQRAFSLRQVVESVLASMRGLAVAKGLRLECVEEEENLHPTLWGDDLRLLQILVNLVANAITFTKTGAVIVRLATATQAEGDRVVELHSTVQDTGIGIPRENLATIFNGLGQVDPGCARSSAGPSGRKSSATSSGIGLGLAISRQLAELMGGRMWVESELGVGSTFHFVVKLVPCREEEESPADNDNRLARAGGKGLASVAGIIEHIERQTGISREQAAAIWAKACRNIEELTMKCRAAHERADWPELGASAHALKGILLQCGLVFLAETAQELDEYRKHMTPAPEKMALLLTSLESGVGQFFQAASGPAVAASAEPDVPEATTTPDIRVLLMEDDTLMQGLIPQMFTALGVAVTVVGEGETALTEYRRAQAEGWPFSLVILDLQIPGGIGGRETAARILALDPVANLVACSGDSSDPVIVNYPDYGFLSVMRKPYTLEKFRELLMAQLA